MVVNGWGMGEGHSGGLAQYARVPASFLVKLPQNISTRHAMAIGTAGYTASLCVDALEAQGVTPDHGDILVTGASGGVGSVAVALLAARGFSVAASTGKPDAADYLKNLGATSIIDATHSPRQANHCRRSNGQGSSTRSVVTPWQTPVHRPATVVSSQPVALRKVRRYQRPSCRLS